MSAPLARFVLPLLALLVLGGCSLFEADSTRAPNGPVLPLHVGNTWTLTGSPDAEDVASTYRVARTESASGRRYFVISGVDGYGTYVVRAGPDGRIFRLGDDGERLWFDPTVADGDSYTYQQLTVTVTKNVTVETPAGTFTNGIRFYFDTPQVVDEEYEWVLVPGIGIARWSNAWFGPRLLKRYDVGPL